MRDGLMAKYIKPWTLSGTQCGLLPTTVGCMSMVHRFER